MNGGIVMAICEKCQAEFDEWMAEDEFLNGVDTPFILSYERLGKCLCGSCAIEEYNNGNYYEECECCGKEFHPAEEELDFQAQVSYRVLDADMSEFGILCADCAACKLFESLDD